MKSFWHSFVNYGLYILGFVGAFAGSITNYIGGNHNAAMWAAVAASWTMSAFFANMRANLASNALGAIARILVKHAADTKDQNK